VNEAQTEDKTEEDPLADEPVPTYEDFLNELADDFVNTPMVQMFKGTIEFVRYLFTRELLVINLLLQKDIIQAEEVETFFGEKVHEEAQEQGLKSLTKHLLREASQGKMVTPEGKTMRPGDVLVVLNDILDLNDTGWDGKTIEVIAELRGVETSLRDQYEEGIKRIETTNKIRALRRKKREQTKELEARQRVERERKVQIYCSQCRVAETVLPTDEEQQQMIEGQIPIPGAP
jgi:hypothetical protein